jgi:4-hydroxy-3-methylbut-2-en-1-yl diphosphate synthase IspG/GcpE
MIEVNFKTQENINVHVSEWDDGGVWIRLGVRTGSLYAALTREEAKQLLEGLQAILAKEVAA